MFTTNSFCNSWMFCWCAHGFCLSKLLLSRSQNRAAQQSAMTGKQSHDEVVQKGRQLIQKANKSARCIFWGVKAYFFLSCNGPFPNHWDFSQWSMTYVWHFGRVRLTDVDHKLCLHSPHSPIHLALDTKWRLLCLWNGVWLQMKGADGGLLFWHVLATMLKYSSIWRESAYKRT